jgi:pyrimidine operon attenuation protein/uracil phosphoribosyltransferase
MALKNYILDKSVTEKKLKRMALQIIEKNPGEDHFILAGIRGSGATVARNIQRHLAEISSAGTSLVTIQLDKRNPGEVSLDREIDVNNKVVIVIDDVANSGKTLLYALKPFLEHHPRKIQTLVLVERKHNIFPVHADYVGLSVATTLQEHINVEVQGDQLIGAWME